MDNLNSIINCGNETFEGFVVSGDEDYLVKSNRELDWFQGIDGEKILCIDNNLKNSADAIVETRPPSLRFVGVSRVNESGTIIGN